MFNELLNKLKAFNLPPEKYVVVGSGALGVRGLRASKDLDIIVTKDLWDELAKINPVTKNEWEINTIVLDKNIEALDPAQSLFGNSKEIPIGEIFREADVIDGIKYINLKHLKEFKREFGREKDLKDIELIDNYLSRTDS